MKQLQSTYWIVPSFNEGDSLLQVCLDLVEAGVPSSNIVLVDDGSTVGVLREKDILQTGVTLIRHLVNLGQGAALQTGIDYALETGAEYIVTFDADGQHSVEDAIKMISQLVTQQELSCVIGSRFLGSAEGIAGSRKLTLKLGILFTFFMTGYMFIDVHNGLRVFRRSFFDNFRFKENRMEHASEILEFLAQHPSSFEEIPVTIKYSEYSKAKGQSSFNGIKIALRTVIAKLIRL